MTQAQPNRRMGDDEMGQVARGLLTTLSSTTTDEGRLAAVMRTLWHIESTTLNVARAEAGRTANAVPAWEETSGVPNTTVSIDRSQPSEQRALEVVAPRSEHIAWTTKPMIEQAAIVRGMSNQDIERLIASSPGPLTEYLRRVTSVAANALLACQFGSFLDAAPMMRWCADAMMTMRKRWSSQEDSHPLCVASALALAGSAAAELQHTTLAAATIRRVTANLAAMARAAARLEGKPEADPVFEGQEPILSTISGLDRQIAAAVAKDIALAVDLKLENAIRK